MHLDFHAGHLNEQSFSDGQWSITQYSLMVTVVCLVHVLHIRVPSTCMWSINTLAVANEIVTCMLSFPLAVRTFLIKIRVIGLQPEDEKTSTWSDWSTPSSSSFSPALHRPTPPLLCQTWANHLSSKAPSTRPLTNLTVHLVFLSASFTMFLVSAFNFRTIFSSFLMICSWAGGKDKYKKLEPVIIQWHVFNTKNI